MVLCSRNNWVFAGKSIEGHDIAAFAPGVVKVGHLIHLFGMSFREVILFGSIRNGVVKFPRLPRAGHELPLFQSNCAIAFVLQKNRRRTWTIFAFKDWQQTASFQWLNRVAVIIFGIFC